MTRRTGLALGLVLLLVIGAGAPRAAMRGGHGGGLGFSAAVPSLLSGSPCGGDDNRRGCFGIPRMPAS